MPGPKPDPEAVEYALDALKSGRTPKDIATELTRDGYPVTATTIIRWKAAADKPKPPPAEQKAAGKKLISDLRERFQEGQPPEPEAEPIDPKDLLASTRKMLADMIRDAHAAKSVGNYTASQRGMRDAANMTAVIARLEKASQADADILRLSRQEIEENMVAVRARVAAITARPLLCSKCSRELSVEWGAKEKK